MLVRKVSSPVEFEPTEQSPVQARWEGIAVSKVAPPEDAPSATHLGISVDLAAAARRSEAWQQQQGDQVRMVSALHYARAETLERPHRTEIAQRAGLGEGMIGARRLETSTDPTAIKDAGETATARSSSNPAEHVSRVIDRLVELRRELMPDAGNQVPREFKA